MSDREKAKSEFVDRCMRDGLTPMTGVKISPENGGSIGQFLINPSLARVVNFTKDPYTYLGGASKAEQKRWTDEEREYAELQGLIQREFSNKKRKNVDSIKEYLKGILDGDVVGFLPAPILWFPDDGDVYVQDEFMGVRSGAHPHIIDGSTRLAAIHRLWREEPAYRVKMQAFNIPLIVIYGGDVDEDVAAQVFCDVNFKAIPVDPSTAKAMDKRDPHVTLSKELEKTIPLLKDRVSKRRQLTASDTALLTRYALYQSLRCFTDGVESLAKSFESKVLAEWPNPEVTGKAIDLWRELEQLFGQEWLGAGNREKYLHVQAPILKAIACFMRPAYFPMVDAAKKKERLDFLASLDWDRSNPGWIGIATKAASSKEKGVNILNNDPVVRELTKRLEQRDSALPRVDRAAAA